MCGALAVDLRVPRPEADGLLDESQVHPTQWTNTAHAVWPRFDADLMASEKGSAQAADIPAGMADAHCDICPGPPLRPGRPLISGSSSLSVG